jgi:hypothetical protein
MATMVLRTTRRRGVSPPATRSAPPLSSDRAIALSPHSVPTESEPSCSMPRLRIISDLHLECLPWSYHPAGEDLLILAGDVADFSPRGRSRRQQLWCEIDRAQIPAVYVLGNHEGYGAMIARDTLVATLRAELPPRVRILDREGIEVLGLHLLGCTLWTDFSLSENIGKHARGLSAHERGLRCEQEINDFVHLYLRQPQSQPGQLHQVRAADMAVWHHEERAWLDQAIAHAHLPTVVITHFLPAPKSILPQYRDNVLNAYFATDCRELFRPPVRLWVHGHTHGSCDYRHADLRIVCNPRGYSRFGVRENAEFDDELIIDLPIPPAPGLGVVS